MSTDTLELTIRLSNGTRLPLVVGEVSPTNCTVRQVKEKLVHECPVERQRLIYKGRILEDERSLQDYGIVTKSTLFLVKGSAPSSAPSTAPTTTTTTTPSVASTATTTSHASPPPVPAGNPPPSAAAFASAFPSAPSPAPNTGPTNPWASAGNSSANNPFLAGGAGLNHPMMSNPEQMRQMMNNPLMSSLLDNPQMLQSIMEMQMQANPQMRQLVDSNPMLREVFNDPAVLQQAVHMMRNPAAMQQALRNQDLAMSNIENMPGGFAALSNMYRDVQQPLQESMMGSSSTGSGASGPNNPSNSNAGAAGSAMPNPWGNPAPQAPSSSSQPSSTNAAGNASATNPFAAMMGGADAANPFAAMMGSTGGPGASNPMAAAVNGSNPWANAATGMPRQPSPDQMNAAISMMENPMIQQMMDQALNQNPEFFRNMLASQNPLLGQMFQDNPEAATNMIRTMMNPQVMRSMAQMQQAMGGFTNPSGPPPTAFSASGNTSTGFPSGGGSLDFSSMIQSLQGSPFGAPPPAPPQNPADRYRIQLRSLYDMGFDDEQQSLAALQAAHGNLNRAVDMLLMGEVPPTTPEPAAGASPPAPPPATDNGAAEESPPSEPKDAQEKKND
jgi:ubiquilin